MPFRIRMVEGMTFPTISDDLIDLMAARMYHTMVDVFDQFEGLAECSKRHRWDIQCDQLKDHWRMVAREAYCVMAWKAGAKVLPLGCPL